MKLYTRKQVQDVNVKSTKSGDKTTESVQKNRPEQELMKKIRILELQNSMLTRQVQEMQAELTKLTTTQVKSLADLYRCKEEIKLLRLEAKKVSENSEIHAFRQELDRLKLTAKLNTNAIERLVRKEE